MDDCDSAIAPILGELHWAMMEREPMFGIDGILRSPKEVSHLVIRLSTTELYSWRFGDGIFSRTG